MNYITHSIGGLGAGLAMVSLLGNLDPISTATIVAGATLGSLLPDIDHTKSFIGRKAPVTSHVVSAVSKHRGFFHTPVAIVVAAVALSVGIPLFLEGQIQNSAILFATGLIPGMLSHIILDTFNKGGISWLWPISKKRFRVLSIRTDGLMEKLFTIGLASMVGYLFFY